MALYFEGSLQSASVLRMPTPDKDALYAFRISDDDGMGIEVLTNRMLGKRGDVVQVAVRASVRTAKDGKLTDQVTFWDNERGGSAVKTVPGFDDSGDVSLPSPDRKAA